MIANLAALTMILLGTAGLSLMFITQSQKALASSLTLFAFSSAISPMLICFGVFLAVFS